VKSPRYALAPVLDRGNKLTLEPSRSRARARDRVEDSAAERLLDHEKLDVYQLLLEFIAWVTVLIDEVRESEGARVSEVCNHLDQASLSALFNTAEGNGKRSPGLRRRFFDDARGSAKECAACLDALIAKGACRAERVVEGKALLSRIVSILTKLVQCFSPAGRARDSEEEYESGHEYEDEYEDEYEYEEQ
jgi:four helix bundle protein